METTVPCDCFAPRSALWECDFSKADSASANDSVGSSTESFGVAVDSGRLRFVMLCTVSFSHESAHSQELSRARFHVFHTGAWDRCIDESPAVPCLALHFAFMESWSLWVWYAAWLKGDRQCC